MSQWNPGTDLQGVGQMDFLCISRNQWSCDSLKRNVAAAVELEGSWKYFPPRVAFCSLLPLLWLFAVTVYLKLFK